MPTVAINSRAKLLSGLLGAELEPNLGLSGTGQDVSIMRSTLVQTGVIKNVGKAPEIVVAPEDKNMRFMLNTIQSFLMHAGANGEQNFSVLYKHLTQPEYGIGLKTGVIPIYIAAIIHLNRSKSAEFAQAVRSLLGLSAFQSALEHLGGRNSVMKMYNESYDTKSDSKMAQYSKEIEEYEKKLQAIEERLAAIESEESIANDKKAELEEEIRLNKDSEVLARERDELVRKIRELIDKKASSEDSLLKVFNLNAHSYFAKKMMSDALSQLAAADKIDRGIPYIHAKTIEFLIKRKKCICGADIEFGNDAYKELNDLAELHQYAIHRDIKPENILVKGEKWILSDFGLCQALLPEDRIDVTDYNEKIGPAFWMSPEAVDQHYFGNADITACSDVYQMCAIFAFVLTKHYPGGIITDQSTLNTTPEISNLILTALSNVSSLRPQNGTELLDRYNAVTYI